MIARLIVIWEQQLCCNPQTLTITDSSWTQETENWGQGCLRIAAALKHLPHSVFSFLSSNSLAKLVSSLLWKLSCLAQISRCLIFRRIIKLVTTLRLNWKTALKSNFSLTQLNIDQNIRLKHSILPRNKRLADQLVEAASKNDLEKLKQLAPTRCVSPISRGQGWVHSIGGGSIPVTKTLWKSFSISERQAKCVHTI